MNKLIYPTLIGIFFCLTCITVPISAQSGPGAYPPGEVPDAVTGFRHPLSVTEVEPGWQFGEWASGYACGSVWHPARDINAVAPGAADLGTPVYAAAAGKVVFANGGSWGGIVIQHKYRGVTYLSQYGHVRGIRVQRGATVTKGQQIAEIGQVGATSPHLHFEIRESDHPDPTLGSFFTCGQSLQNVQNWYENPVPFTRTHTSYAQGSPYVWRFDEAAYFEEWEAFNISAAAVQNGILFIDPQGADPHIQSGPLAAVAYTYPYVQFRMASNALDGNGAIYFKTRLENYYSEDKKITFYVAHCAPEACAGNAPFQYYEVPVGWHPKWVNTITGLRIDPANNGRSGTATDTIGFDFVRLSAVSVPQ
jgi:murein DD-endopeptidase MepM/ murein hydrolase activator NlpD